MSAGVDGTFALWITVPFRATTQICVSAIETSKPAKYSIVGSPLPMTEPILSALGKSRRPLPDVEELGRCWVLGDRRIIRGRAEESSLTPLERTLGWGSAWPVFGGSGRWRRGGTHRGRRKARAAATGRASGCA